MKREYRILGGLALLAFVTLNPQLSTVCAQGTAFTYQGELASGGYAANGLYDFTFAVWNAGSGGVQQGATLATNAVPVTNGYFIATMDFGNVFPGGARWLEIAVRTNGGTAYSTLAPRQPLTPTPYAIMANNASNLLGWLPAGQLSGTAGTATNFTGSLSGDVVGKQNATAVAYVGAQSAANVASGVTAANAATNADTPGTIVARDPSGSFAAGTLTVNGALILPGLLFATDTIYASNLTFIHNYGTGNFFAGVAAGNLTMSGANNTAVGCEALHINTSGSGNAANGGYALYHNQAGTANTASGYEALYDNSSGSDNGASGYQALYNNTTGWNNTACGYQALYYNGTGSNNMAAGYNALYWNDGSYNTAIGQQALALNDVGSNNIALGFQAGYNIFDNNNIDVGNAGSSSDNGVIRIGTPGIHNTTIFVGLQLQQNSATNGAADVIAGSPANYVASGAIGGTIGGGGATNYYGYPYTNSVLADFGTVAGGYGNSTVGYEATVSGGDENVAGGTGSTVGGGANNTIGLAAYNAVIGGGGNNNIQPGADGAVLGGGIHNSVGTNCLYAVIGGGQQNLVTNGSYATVPGGYDAVAGHYGQMAYASGGLATAGDAQASLFVLRTYASGSTYQSLYLDGSRQMLTIPTGAVWAFDILVAGGINGGPSAAYKISGVIRNYSGAVAFVGTPSVTTLGADAGASAWGAKAAADSGALDVQVAGSGTAPVSWVANVRTAEVTPTY